MLFHGAFQRNRGDGREDIVPRANGTQAAGNFQQFTPNVRDRFQAVERSQRAKLGERQGSSVQQRMSLHYCRFLPPTLLFTRRGNMRALSDHLNAENHI